MRKAIISCILSVITSQATYADTYPVDNLVANPRPALFSICYHGTCESTTEVRLTEREWQKVREIFKDEQSGKKERLQISKAVALMETIVGEKTGTNKDKSGTFAYLGQEGQLDCIDESINTSFYITMMQNDGLIRSHKIEDRAHRGFFLNGWPHSTAVIRDLSDNSLYAVDAWFLDNGQPPYIIPLQQWDDGWKPDSFKEWSR